MTAAMVRARILISIHSASTIAPEITLFRAGRYQRHSNFLRPMSSKGTSHTNFDPLARQPRQGLRGRPRYGRPVRPAHGISCPPCLGAGHEKFGNCMAPDDFIDDFIQVIGVF